MPPAKVKIQRIEVRACTRGRGAGGGRGAVGCGGQLPAPVPCTYPCGCCFTQERPPGVPLLCPYRRLPRTERLTVPC
jgi:hypothetical protein